MSTSSLPEHKAKLLSTALATKALQFGTFELKSKRLSPYFFNTAFLDGGAAVEALASALALTIDHQLASSNFDVIFGPAYKGIPLAALATLALRQLRPDRYSDVRYSFDRKEVKDHGEGGSIVGRPLKSSRVLIIDDVISAGTAKREAIDKIRAEGGEVVAIVVVLDRQETLPGHTKSAIGELRKEYSLPIVAILTLADIIAGAKGGLASEADIGRIEEYRAQYGATD